MKMDFTYGGADADTPPTGDQGETPVVGRKNLTGSRAVLRDDKSRSSLRAGSSQKMFAPVFKKHHTVA